VFKPISLKTNNKNTIILFYYVHICVYSNANIYSCISKLWYTVSQQVYQGIYHGKLIDTLVMSQVWI